MLFLQHFEGFMEIFRELKKVPAFAGVSDKELQAMSSCFKAEICFFDKGQEIIRQGDPLDKVILISKGEANAQNEDMFGNISIILNLNVIFELSVSEIILYPSSDKFSCKTSFDSSVTTPVVGFMKHSGGNITHHQF